MTLKAGSAFLLTSTGGMMNPAGGHLCVCLTNPCAKGDLLAVTIQTYYPGFDTSCVLDLGDHDFIQHKSVATYSRCIKIYGVMTEKLIDNGTYTKFPDVTPSLLAKLRKGLKASGDTEPYFLAYAKSQGI